VLRNKHLSIRAPNKTVIVDSQEEPSQESFIALPVTLTATTPVSVMTKISCWAIMEATAGLSCKGMRALQILRSSAAICRTL
jgi:hypothetical protein